MQVSTIRPGLLVSLKTTVIGNTEYERVTLETDHLTEDGAKKARWETTRVVTDPVEREKAVEARGQCRRLISRVCSTSTFGLLCPEDKKPELDAAVKEAQSLANAFNASAKLTRIGIYVIAGRIAADDAEAARAINGEVRELLSDMEAGLKNLDVKAVREAANKAKSIGRMLSPDAASKIKEAVDAARDMARQIVKAGEEAATAIDRAAIQRIRESRTMFLDLEETPVEVSSPAAEARAIDLEPESEQAPRKKAAQPQLEV